MQNQTKNKKGSKKDEPLFTEQERNRIPFVRTVSNKMRNITKKLTQISELELKQVDQLKPQQKDKISKRQLLIDEQAKYEEVLKLYKTIESQRNQNELSEADKTINLLEVVRILTEEPDQLTSKGILTKDEIKPLCGFTEGHHKSKNMKQHLEFVRNYVSDYLKNDGLQTIIEKIVAHKEFGNLKTHYQHHTQKQQLAKQNIAKEKSRKEEKEKIEHKEREQNVVTNETANLVKTEPTELLTTSQNLSPSEQQHQNPSQLLATVPQSTTPSQDERSKATDQQPQIQEERKIEQPQRQSQSANSSKRQVYYPRRENPRSRGSNNPLNVNDKAQDEGHFTRQQRAELDKQGFIVIEKKPKVVSKNSGKQFGPNRDNRQYHQ